MQRMTKQRQDSDDPLKYPGDLAASDQRNNSEELQLAGENWNNLAK